MLLIDSKFKTLRINLRRYGKEIAENAFKRFHPITKFPYENEICVFCKSESNITSEHVLPQWLIKECVNDPFISSVNRQTLNYKKALVPACSNCNNGILAEIEKYIIKTLGRIDVGDISVDMDDLYNIIRWMEVIEYKFQILDCRRKYIKYENSPYNREFGTIPVAMMRHFIDMAPWKAYDWLRNSQRRITVKSKIERINSLVVLKPSIPHFYFFAQPNQYLYISFPMYRVGTFYFFKKNFDDYKDAFGEAVSIIKKVMKSP